MYLMAGERAELTSEATTFGVSPSSNSDLAAMLQSVDFSSNLDWLLEPQPGAFPLFDEADDGGTMESFMNFFGGIDAPSDARQQLVAPGSGFSAPSQPASPSISGLPTPHPREDCTPDDPWPMVWHARKNHRLRFPPLELPGGFVHRPYFSPHTYISTNVLTEMQQLVNMTSMGAEDLRLPEPAKLNHFIDLYFTNFSQVMSIVHCPTFDPRASIVVTLSMAALGILYSSFPRAREFSYTLSELIRKMLILMVRHSRHLSLPIESTIVTDLQEEYDRRFVRTEDHLTAQLLQGFHGYCSGSQRLFELSETSRGSLVTNARRMGLLTKEKPEQPSQAMPPESLNATWHDWIRKERLRRIGWAVYVRCLTPIQVRRIVDRSVR
jgi:hypothetical protein